MEIRNIILVLLTVLMFGGCDVNKQQDIIKQIDFKEVLWFAERADALSMTEAQIKKFFPNTVRVADMANIEVMYFLEQYPETKRQVIVVRGAVNLKNIKETVDYDYILSKNKKLGIYVHHGFDEVAMEVYADVLPHLHKDYSVALTGHSMGAAISNLLMMYLYEDGFDLERSVNFGQPKVTNSKGVNRYGFLPLTRIVHENDLVALLPPITLLDAIHGFYEHMGEEVILLEGEYYAYLERHDAERKSVGSFWKNIGHESIGDHVMGAYLKNIKGKQSHTVQVSYRQREKYIP
jgi:hypothetical protein